jgi:four helix bundle protein
MKDFRRLKVWEKVHVLTLEIYKVAARLPREEVCGLTSQMRRCSASIGSAEGCGKQGNNEFHRFLYIASGSASELDYHLLLAKDPGYLSGEDYQRMGQNLLEARRMLTALVQKVSADRFAANC